MKRTTVFADDEVMKKLKAIAKRENCTLSEITRKALNEFVYRRARKRSRVSFIGTGKRGRKDVAERSEQHPEDIDWAESSTKLLSKRLSKEKW